MWIDERLGFITAHERLDLTAECGLMVQVLVLVQVQVQPDQENEVLEQSRGAASSRHSW